MKHLVLIDASGLIYRAHHSRPPLARKSDGMRIETALGFAQMLWELVGRAQADPYDYIGCIFDHAGPTFRHKLYPAYKSARVRPPGLTEQFPATRQAAIALGMEPVEMEGFEADDILATLAERATAENIRTTIVTVDKDLCQLVREGMVEIVDPVSKNRIRTAEVIAKFGVTPRLVPDVQALCGDAVDGIPGVPGIGMKSAAGLIRRFGSLDGLLVALDRPRAYIPGRDGLQRERKNIPIYRELAALRTDVDLKINFHDLRPKPVRRDDLTDYLEALEADKMHANLFRLPGARPDQRMVERLPKKVNPLEWWSEELKAKGQKVPDEPQDGYYKRRMFKGGEDIPIRIWREPHASGQDILLCARGDTRVDPYAEWGHCWMNPIRKAVYVAMSKKAPAAPHDDEAATTAAPGKPDFLNMPAPTFRKRTRK